MAKRVNLWGDDKPREKWRLKGKESLSDAELIAILLRSGSRGESAMSLSRRLLKSVQSLDLLSRKDLSYLKQFKGIGEVKAMNILAAIELGRRRQVETIEMRPQIRSSQEAFQILGPLLRDLGHEEFWIACLNRRNELLTKLNVSKGGISATVVDPKVIFKQAIGQGASSLILFHNHPSGCIQPSEEDIRVTRKLSAAGQLLEVKILDHLIVGNGTYYSFADEGFL